MRTKRYLVTLLLVCFTSVAGAQESRQPITQPVPNCTWESVGYKYNIHPALLYAIAKTESGIRPHVTSAPNKNGSYDIGMMQINSSWLPTLAKHGITEKHLYDPCVSLDVGAWVLHHNMQRYGNSWTAVGAYNAMSPDKRVVYARKVFNNIPPIYRHVAQ